LVLGCRHFDSSVPLRSLIGNKLTRLVLRGLTGQNLSDTQTGLRGIPMAFLPSLLRLEPNGYDFELEMLLVARREKRLILEVPIRTIYLDSNRASHFNPLIDSTRVYFVFVRFCAVSVLTALLDNFAFLLLLLAGASLVTSQAGARLIAGLFNYTSNKIAAFRSRAPMRVSLPRYCIVVAASGTVSFALITVLVKMAGMAVMPAKLLTEMLLFFANFAVLRDYVFLRNLPEE
jgi:putative flippase GtrA